jgi:hypothetical protein
MITQGRPRVIYAPVFHGGNRLRGKEEGFLFDTDEGELEVLKEVLKEEALLDPRGDEHPTPEWVTGSLKGLLDLYTQADIDWERNKDGTVGHVWEGCLPSGVRIRMGERRVLARVRDIP